MIRKKIVTVEDTYEAVLDAVKDLEPREFANVMEAVNLGYRAYQKAKNVSDDDIDKIAKKMAKAKEAKNAKN